MLTHDNPIFQKKTKKRSKGPNYKLTWAPRQFQKRTVNAILYARTICLKYK